MRFHVIISALSLIFCLCTIVSVSESAAQNKPNILLIMLDDGNIEETYIDFLQTQETYFPNIKLLAQQGIRFTNAHCTSPLCGPSRAAFMRGQYAHKVGVRVNNPDIKQSQTFGGGFPLYKAQGFTNNDLGTWMKDQNYKTYFVGKYLHTGYNHEHVAGFDEFYVSLGSKYYGVSRTINGTRVNTTNTQYRTKIETDDVVRMMEEHQAIRNANGRPFFMMYTPLAPHDVALNDTLGMVESKYKSLWKNKLAPKPADYSEIDISDKPAVYHRLPRLNNVKRQATNKLYRDRIRSLKSVDDSIARFRSKLNELGELDNTYIILMSDNGYQNGNHRTFGKMDPFNRNTNIPLIIFGPDVASNKVANHLIAHIDVTATLVELAGGTPKSFVDGKSFKSLLANPAGTPEETWRDPILIENYQIKLHHTPRIADFIQLQMSYLSVRAFDEVYNEWSTGEKEYYNLALDPLQLVNSYDGLSAGDKLLFSNLLGVARDANLKPRTYIAKPHEHFTARPMNIKGLAEGAGGITKVNLLIKNLDRNKFWNGTAWQTASTTIEANVSGNKGLLSNWEYTVPITSDDDNHRILVTARAFDDAGRFSGPTIPSIVARVDGERPNATIARPAANANVNRSKIVIAGVATDNHGMDQVRLLVRNLDNGRYWNGKNWQSDQYFLILKAPNFGQKTMNWKYQFAAPAKAKINVIARAYDRVNNRDLSPATQTFNAK